MKIKFASDADFAADLRLAGKSFKVVRVFGVMYGEVFAGIIMTKPK